MKKNEKGKKSTTKSNVKQVIPAMEKKIEIKQNNDLENI